jgi:hypothetical protein
MDSDPQWPEERRKRVTASDMLCFLGLEPKWWSGSWSEILQGKLTGRPLELDLGGRVRVRHGSRTEALNLELTSELLGFAITPHRALYVNARWPYLGATLDGLLWTQRGLGPNLDLSTLTGQTAETYERLSGLPGPVMVESKNASEPFKRNGVYSSWLGDATYPDYYVPQIQTGMHIADFSHCLLAGRIGGRDLSVYLVERDPEWASRLDEASADAEIALGKLWTL